MASLFLSRGLVLGALAGAVLLASSHAAHAQSFGVNAGVFFPSSSKTKDAFGSNFKSLGLGLGRVGLSQRRVSPDLNFLRQDRGGNSATVVFAGAKILVPLGQLPAAGASRAFAPYSGVGLNLIYADVNAPDYGINKTGFGGAASVILGASIGDHLFAEGRYRLATSAANFNFSGSQISVGVRF